MNYNPYPAATIPTSENSFTLNVVDSCLNTKVSAVPSEIERIVVVAGYGSKSLDKYSFEDSVSL